MIGWLAMIGPFLFLLAQSGIQVPAAPPLVTTSAPARSGPAPVVMSGRELSYLSRIHSAREAVMAAADQAPRGYLGRVSFSIRAVGWDGGRLFLNSETDYRDPRNLSVVVHPQIAKEVLNQLGGTEDAALQRKVVIVTGLFQRVRIEFLEDERPTGKYYYQTHLALDHLNQFRTVDLKN